MTRRPVLKASILILVAYAMSSVQYWHFMYWHERHIERLYQSQDRLLEGRVLWLNHQNRVLAPLIIRGMEKCFSWKYDKAYNHFMYWSFVMQNVLVALLLLRCGVETINCLIGLVVAVGVPVLGFNYWWWPWSNVEGILWALLFLIDACVQRERRRLVAYVGLFIVWMLNKETCIFVAAWILLRDAACRWSSQPGSVRRTVPVLIASGVMLAASVATPSILRRTMWVQSTEPDIPGMTPSGIPSHVPAIGPNHFLLFERTIPNILQSLKGMASYSLPYPTPDPPRSWRWPYWSPGGVIFLLAFLGSLTAFVAGLLRQDQDMFVLSFMSLALLLAWGALSNIPEGDKIVPVMMCGLYGYAIRERRRLQEAQPAAIA